MKSNPIVLLFILLSFDEQRNGVLPCGQLHTTLIPLLTNTNETHHWPWHVGIYHELSESCTMYQCGGTLISSKSILTAAHCLMVDAEQVIVSLGRLLLDACEDSASFNRVTEIIRHPSFRAEYQEHDIAVAVLATNVIFNNYVQPVCLWRADKSDLSEIIGKYGTVVGWGITETGKVSNALRQASLPVVDITTCLESNRDLFGQFLSNTNFCAGSRNGTGVCTGDSGGSMTFEVNGTFYIRGVVSIGPSKFIQETHEVVCDPTQYSIFTDVVRYLPWIRSVANILASNEDCDVRVRCDWSEGDHRCTVVINSDVHHSSADCGIIFDEVSNSAVNQLKVSGQSDDIPELSDAAAKFQNLNSLMLTNISLKVVERPRLVPFQNLQLLDLSTNHISQLDVDTFDDLSELVVLGLNFNQLTELHPNLFKHLKNLVELGFGENNIETLPADIFRNNVNLTHLGFAKNQLKELHADLFAQLPNLATLYLHSNRLELLPAGIFRNNVNLRELYLAHNNLKELHVDIFANLINLEEIQLFSNELECLPPDLFLNNTKLKGLHLFENQLKELVHIEQLLHLENLWLHENKLKTIPKGAFHNNRKLRSLSLSGNQLRELDVDLFKNLVDLEVLHVYDNLLAELPADIFRNNVNLQQLQLSRNRFKDLHPDLFVNLINLKDFFLHDNQLETLPSSIFRNNIMATKLYLSANHLKELHADLLTGLINLEEMVANHNQLETIPAGLFRNNTKLTHIDLSFNKIKKIHSDFHQITHAAIGRLNLSKNVCVDESCGYSDSCDALSLTKIFDEIEKNC